MKHRSHSLNSRSRQSGVVLFVALILLVILSLIGVTAARMQTVEERMARNEDNHQLAAQAAEAALRSAEGGLLSGILHEFRRQHQRSLRAHRIQWKLGRARCHELGFCGRRVSVFAGPPLASIPAGAQAPKFVIENLPAVAVPGESINQVQICDAHHTGGRLPGHRHRHGRRQEFHHDDPKHRALAHASQEIIMQTSISTARHATLTTSAGLVHVRPSVWSGWADRYPPQPRRRPRADQPDADDGHHSGAPADHAGGCEIRSPWTGICPARS